MYNSAHCKNPSFVSIKSFSHLNPKTYFFCQKQSIIAAGNEQYVLPSIDGKPSPMFTGIQRKYTHTHTHTHTEKFHLKPPTKNTILFSLDVTIRVTISTVCVCVMYFKKLFDEDLLFLFVAFAFI